MIRVVIADDHALVRDGLRSLLHATEGIRVVGEAPDGDELLEVLVRTPCEVVLLDITMPGPGFQELLRRIAVAHPEVRTIVVSMHDEQQFALRAFRAGASGYVGKDRSFEEVAEAVLRVVRGRRYVSPVLAEQLVAGDAAEGGSPALSEREFEVLRLLVHGRAQKEIAAELGVSPKTVSTYRARILEKLGLSSTAELVRYAIEHRLGDDESPAGADDS